MNDARTAIGSFVERAAPPRFTIDDVARRHARRRRNRRARAATLALVVFALVAGGFVAAVPFPGGGQPAGRPVIDREEFLDRATGVCYAVFKRLYDEVGAADGSLQFRPSGRKYFRAVQDELASLVAGLRSLTPPPTDRLAYERVLLEIERLIPLAREAAGALRRPGNAYDIALEEYRSQLREARTRSILLGLRPVSSSHVC